MLDDVTTWEMMVAATGGTQVTVATVSAWAHVQQVPVMAGDGPGIQAMARTAVVHRSRLPSNPIGAAVVIGGATYKVVELGDGSDDAGRELMLRRS